MPAWWRALTDYVAQMQAAWLAFATDGRPAHPSLRITFAMLAGLAPLHGERLAARGAPVRHDPLSFYGSDRPVVSPPALHELGAAARAAIARSNTARVLQAPAVAA